MTPRGGRGQSHTSARYSERMSHPIHPLPPRSARLGVALCLGLTLSAVQLHAQADTVPAPAPAQEAAPPAPIVPETLLVNRVVAVVGNEPILLTEAQRELATQIARGALEAPADSLAYERLMRDVIQELVDAQLLIQKAEQMLVVVTDEEVDQAVDEQLQRIRANFPSDAAFQEALTREGLGTPEEYRSTLRQDLRSNQLQSRLLPQLQEEGKLPTATVSEDEVTQAWNENKDRLPPKPASVSFRQIVVAPQATPAARERARAHAESLLVQLRGGADFAELARAHSGDPGSAVQGGDLGWNRRGVMVPIFDFWMFELPPGQLSPVVETSFGYHIIRVDRVRPAERSVRHILIIPEVDSTDVARASAEAARVSEALRGGASFDSLVTLHHDAPEEKLINELPLEQLPAQYSAAIGQAEAGAVTDPFSVPDPRGGQAKFVVVQMLARERGGPMTEEEARRVIREQLQQERTIRRYLDRLKSEIHVALFFEEVGGA